MEAHCLPLSVGVPLMQQLVNELLDVVIREGTSRDNIDNAVGRECLHGACSVHVSVHVYIPRTYTV